MHVCVYVRVCTCMCVRACVCVCVVCVGEDEGKEHEGWSSLHVHIINVGLPSQMKVDIKPKLT